MNIKQIEKNGLFLGTN